MLPIPAVATRGAAVYPSSHRVPFFPGNLKDPLTFQTPPTSVGRVLPLGAVAVVVVDLEAVLLHQLRQLRLQRGDLRRDGSRSMLIVLR